MSLNQLNQLNLRLIAWLIVAIVLLLLMSPMAWGEMGAAGAMTLREWRTLPSTGRIYSLLGAIALTDTLGIVCPVPIPIGEWEAALIHRALPETKPWIVVFTSLMDERGCRGIEEKPNA